MSLVVRASLGISYGFDLHKLPGGRIPFGGDTSLLLHSMGRFETTFLHPFEDTVTSLLLWMSDGPMSLVVCSSLDITYGFDNLQVGKVATHSKGTLHHYTGSF